MPAQNNNRYALICDDSDSSSSRTLSVEDLSRDPFLNQIGDDSIPWQEVTKRRTLIAKLPVTLQLPLRSKPSTSTAYRRRLSEVSTAKIMQRGRSRTVSTSTGGSGNADKPDDPHENWCGVCSIKFVSKTSLQGHIKLSGGTHAHYCNLCKRVFKDRNGLKNHVDNSSGHDVFCNLCLSAFKDDWGLQNHFENNHSAGHQWACMTCLMGFHTQHEFERHLQVAPKHTWCTTCKRRFRSQDERDEHWQKTAKHKHCLQPACDFDAPTQALLDEHIQQDHFLCKGCKRIFPSRTQLNRHQEKCIAGVACSQCKAVFAGHTELDRHMQKCLLCPHCNFSSQSEGNLKIHMIKHATASFPCWACRMPLRSHSAMINHLESGGCPSFTDPTRLILCLGKWWYSPLYMDLDIHAQIRTGRINLGEMCKWMREGLLEPFVCREENCGQTFGHFSSLVQHCESRACKWEVERLNLVRLEREFRGLWRGESSAAQRSDSYDLRL